jgi:hypothetical protein
MEYFMAVAEIFIFVFILILTISFYYIVWDCARKGFKNIAMSLYNQSQIVSKFMAYSARDDPEMNVFKDEYAEETQNMERFLKKV